MEKVYKHKKTGQIAYYKDGVFKQNNCSVEIGVEPSSEFWTELTYEILSFRSHRNRFYNLTIQKDGTYLDAKIMEFDGNGASLEWMLNEDEYYITSVKRLSDSEVFSIGDKINFRGLYGNNSEHKYDIIKGFDLKQDANLGVLYHNGLVGLSKIEKYKESVFTTFDGVEIFKNQSYWGLYTKTWLLEYVDGGIDYDLEEDELPDNTYLTFAKKENAINYVKEHKKLFSISDIVNFVNNIPEGRISTDDVINFFNLWDK